MRHRSGQRKLNITDGAHRAALLRNMGNALLRYERITTTLIRAKELRRFVEPLITRGKKNSVANRRLVFSRLRDRDNVVKLFDDLGVRFADRPGGYLRILKHGFRPGDNAPLALVELVERREEESAPAAPAPASEAKQQDTQAAAVDENTSVDSGDEAVKSTAASSEAAETSSASETLGKKHDDK